MRLAVSENSLPRLHLIGTLLVVLAVTLSLFGVFSWQNLKDQHAALERVEQVTQQQQSARLVAEIASIRGYLDFVRSRTEATLRESLREQVDTALAMVQAIYERETPRRPVQDVQRLIIETLRPARFFEGRGYYFIDDMKGQFILLPTAPQFEGKTMLDNRDDTGHYIMRGLIEAAERAPGLGFSSYRWYTPEDPKHMSDKLAYVRRFAPFDWLIGTGDYTHQWEKVQQREALARLRELRFGDSGYVAVLDANGRTLLSPSDPTQEGRHFSDFAEPQRQSAERIYQQARSGGGQVQYQWLNKALGQVQRKTALVNTYEPWGWILVVTMVDDEAHSAFAKALDDVQRGNRDRTFELALALGGAILLGVVSSLLFSRWSSRLFRAYQSEREVYADALRRSEQRLALVIKGSNDAPWDWDIENNQFYFSPQWWHLLGYQPGDLPEDSQLWQRVMHPDDVASTQRNLMRALKSNQDSLSTEFRLQRRDGSYLPVLCRGFISRDALGNATRVTGSNMDLSERKRAESEIRQLAFYDPLTGLPNRRLLLDRLEHSLASSARSQLHGALLFLDLDNFKTINDTLGHDKGDLLLCEVAHRLRQCVREGDSVARFGGDEFVVMLEDLSPDAAESARRAEVVGLKILESIKQPFAISGSDYASSCSMGVTLFRGRDKPVEELLKRADMAMYQAKGDGRNALRFFDPEMHAAIKARMALDNELRQALSEQQFEVYYQPQVDQAERITGMEALVRWNHPSRGLVSPAEFIARAEDSGLIVPLGLWVLKTACEQLARSSQDPDRQHWSIAVNVSSRQFAQPDFFDQVSNILASTGADPRRLKLELTETILLKVDDAVISRMEALQQQGVGFSLDDFGTGYSSLTYLKRLPVDQLKIDQSFVRDLLQDPNDAAIVRSTIALASSLGLHVIAEGVETPQQRDYLLAHGCQAFQGYLFGRPAPWPQMA